MDVPVYTFDAYDCADQCLCNQEDSQSSTLFHFPITPLTGKIARCHSPSAITRAIPQYVQIILNS